MKNIDTDVDIDCYNREHILEDLWHVNAGIFRDKKTFEKHKTGVYFQNIPRNPYNNTALIDYKKAGEYGYFKIDFLNVYFYENIKNEEHLVELLNREPNWKLFQNKQITENLFQLKNQHSLLKKFPPKSIEDLAVILAIIRPGKNHLKDEPWEYIKNHAWDKDSNEAYSFKKSHGIAYAMAIVVNLNLIIEQNPSLNY